MRRFSYFKRKNSPYYYVQLRNPVTGKYLPPRSTRQKEVSEALLVISEWLKHGFPEASDGGRKGISDVIKLDTILTYIKDTPLSFADVQKIAEALEKKESVESIQVKGQNGDSLKLVDFLELFWDYDSSGYVREKHAYGHSIGRRHCYEQSHRLKHWRSFFPGAVQVRDLTRTQLLEFQLYLKEKKGLSPKTINMILDAGTVAFAWLKERGDIDENPAEGLRKFSGRSTKRGILSLDEVRSIFPIPWKDERARVPNLVAMTTGLRAGEILAQKMKNVEENKIHVRHSWSTQDGLKPPKNGEERTVPIVKSVYTALSRLAAHNPHGPNEYIIYQANPGRPCDNKVFCEGLYDALANIKLPNEVERREKQKEMLS